jgi:hypothetical protein
MENPRAGQMRPGGLGAGKGRAVTRRPRPEKRPIFALKIQGQTGPAGIHTKPYRRKKTFRILRNACAWAFGDRPDALREKRWHDQQQWGRP